MNGLVEVQNYIKNFICEKEILQYQIVEIEEKRTRMALLRNEIKKLNTDMDTVNQLGRQISELGNQSQELQNQLDFKKYAIKTQVNLIIDNAVAEAIRKIRIINEEIRELEEKAESQKARNAKYQLQRQEFYLRFGRMPELSDRAEKASMLQEKEAERCMLEIDILDDQIVKIQDEMTVLAMLKRDIKNGNWKSIVVEDEPLEEIVIEELVVEEMQPIEEINVEEFEQIEECYVEEFQPLEEIIIEEFKEENVQRIEENAIDEIEELAKSIVEEIVAEQTKDYNINMMEENEETEIIIAENVSDIINYENEENKPKVIIPLFGQRATISNIIIKIENGELVYKAQMTDDDEVKIYPSKLGEESVLLRDKQNREECKEILINHAISEYKILDKKVVNNIDPLICELLIACAEKYGHNAQELIYSYAQSFASGDVENVPSIVYNLSYIEQSNLTRKEKTIINKICKHARRNDRIDVIEPFSGFRKVKYIFKRLFAINNVKVLPEAKY